MALGLRCTQMAGSTRDSGKTIRGTAKGSNCFQEAVCTKGITCTVDLVARAFSLMQTAKYTMASGWMALNTGMGSGRALFRTLILASGFKARRKGMECTCGPTGTSLKASGKIT